MKRGALQFVFSGGDGDNVAIAGQIARSGLTNNRLLHREEIAWIEENAEAFRKWMCETEGRCDLTREEAIGILAAETLSGVSESFDLHRVGFGSAARAFLTSYYSGPATVDGQTMFGKLPRGGAEYRQELINADTLLTEIGIYELASSQSVWPKGQSATLAAFDEVFAEYADNAATPRAQAFLDALVANPVRAQLVLTAYGRSSYIDDVTPAAKIGLGMLIEAAPESVRADLASAYATGLTGKTGLTASQVEDAILNGTWGATVSAALEEFLLGDLLTRGISLATLPNGRTVILDANGVQYESVEAARIAVGAPNRIATVDPNPGTRPGAVDAEAGGASYYDQYRKAGGSGWDWPDNLGFAGTPSEATMPVGTRLDRYGSADGSFMSPAGTPLEQRAMAPGSAAETLHTYEVTRPLPVIQGEVAPAFGQSGGGTQMLPNLSERVNVDWLVRNGYLREVK